MATPTTIGTMTGRITMLNALRLKDYKLNEHSFERQRDALKNCAKIQRFYPIGKLLYTFIETASLDQFYVRRNVKKKFWRHIFQLQNANPELENGTNLYKCEKK